MKASTLVISGVVAAAIGITALCSVFTVNKGDVAVPILFGKVNHTTQYGEGLHWENPFAKMQHMSVADASIKFVGVETGSNGKPFANGRVFIQTADKMTTGVNVEITLQINRNKVSYLMSQQINGVGDATNRYVNPALHEALQAAGSRIVTAQALFGTEAKEILKTDITEHIQSYLMNDKKIDPSVVGAITVKDVKIQALVLPVRIQEMIEQTKEREEKEEIAKSSERTRQTDARATLFEKQKQAEAKEAEAKAEAFRVKELADAQREQADADLYTEQKKAEGMQSINAQLSAEYIEYMRADASRIAASNYQGGTPSTLMVSGKEAGMPVPFMNIGK